MPEAQKHALREGLSGRYRRGNRCDGCGLTCGVDGDYLTDQEVCEGGDGPGFFLCFRVSCARMRSGMGIEERRAIYTAQRARNEQVEASLRRQEG